MVRSSAFDEMDRLFAEMDRRFDEMRRSMWRPGGADRPAGLSAGEMTVDLHEEDDGYVLYADLPGFETEEIDLSVADGVLAIDASHEVEGEEYARSRSVAERVTLPAGVVEDEATATYRNGVLEIHLPVSEDSRDGRRIEISD